MSNEQNPPVGSRPVPDPTLLTTQQLLREIQSLREIIEARLNGMDKVLELLQSTADRMPTEVDNKVAALQTLHEEKFRSIETQFRERDVRTEQTSRDAKTAVDAALQAAKEAVGKQNDSFTLATAKSESAFIKQIDQMGLLLTQLTTSLDGKINDLKERFVKIEGGTAARHESQIQQNWMIGLLPGIVSAAIAIIAIALVISKG